MKKWIRVVSIIAAFIAFGLSTTELDIHAEQNGACNQSPKQTAFQEAIISK